MLNHIQGWRERGWSVIDARTYEQAWLRFGGSVATHPLVVAQLAEMADIPVRYLAWQQGGEIKAAIPTWGRYLALSKDVLKRKGKKGLFDLGNAEIILPAAADAQAPLRHAARYLSELNQGRFSGLKAQAEALAMARQPEELSKKFRYNQRRERCGRSLISPAPRSRRCTAICSSGAGGSRPPVPSAWPRRSSAFARC